MSETSKSIYHQINITVTNVFIAITTINLKSLNIVRKVQVSVLFMMIN